MEELFHEAAFHLTRLRGLTLGDNVLDRTIFQPYVWEDFYWNTHADSNFVTPPSNMVAPGGWLPINMAEGASQVRINWNAWVQANKNTSQMVCIWPTLGGVPAWEAADLRQAGSLSFYDPAPATVHPFSGKLSTNLFSMGDRFTMGNEAFIDLPLAGKLTIGLLVFSVGEFKIEAASIAGSRLVR